jgi:hypothetical protein
LFGSSIIFRNGSIAMKVETENITDRMVKNKFRNTYLLYGLIMGNNSKMRLIYKYLLSLLFKPANVEN